MVAFNPPIITQEERKQIAADMYKSRLNLQYNGILELNSEKLRIRNFVDEQIRKLEDEFKNNIRSMSNELHNKYDIIEDLQSDRIVQLNQGVSYDILNNLHLNVKLSIIIKFCIEYLELSKSI